MKILQPWLRAALIACCVGSALAQTQPTLSSDEQAALQLAETLYPTLFVQGGALGSTQGYVYRFYQGSGVYVGFRDARIYLLGGPFGSAVQDQGPVSGVLGVLRVEAARVQSLQSAEPVPQLQNLGLESLASVDYSFNAVFSFATSGHKGFYVFGDPLPSNDGVKRKNPNFEFASLKEGARIVAATDGVVAFIREQPASNDFEVFLQPKQGSAWTIAYDHLTNLTVRQGDVVKAGDPLGVPARQPNGILRFEIQINQDIGSDSNGTRVTTHFCPTVLLAESVRTKVLAELAVSMDTWESTFKLELYDSARHAPVGCIKPTLTAAEAEGR